MNTGNGLVGRYRYGTDPSVTPYVFPLRVNELLVCAPIMRQATWTSPLATPGIEQPSDSSA